MKKLYLGLTTCRSLLLKAFVALILLYFIFNLLYKLHFKASPDSVPSITQKYSYEYIKRTQKEPLALETSSDWQNKLKEHINSENPSYYGKISCSSASHDPCIELSLSILVYDENHLNLVIRPLGVIVPEIPHETPFPYMENPNYLNINQSKFVIMEDNQTITISKKETGEEVLTVLIQQLTYTSESSKIEFLVPNTFLFGDISTIYYKPGIVNQHYAQFPFYLQRGSNSTFHTVFFRNQHAEPLSVIDESTGSTVKKCIWRTSQGIFDLHIFLGESTPDDSISKFHNYLGGWTILPLWALGNHESKLGYHSKENFEELFVAHKSANLNLESIISDLNQLEPKRPLLIDEKPFNIEEIRQINEENSVRWIFSLNTWVPVEKRDRWEVSKDQVMKYALKDENGHICLGLNEDKPIIMLDNSRTIKFWKEILETIIQKYQFSGVFLPSATYNPNLSHDLIATCTPGEIDEELLGVQTSRCEEQYHLARFSHLILKSDLHNYLSQSSTMPYLMSEETLAGSGKYSAKFLNIVPSWKGLKMIIQEVIKANFFGIPFSGTSFCGYATLIDNELCLRWFQLAAFTPLLHINYISNKQYEFRQHPYIMPGIYFQVIKQALHTRYSLLKYIYALFIDQEDLGNKRKIGTVFRPLFANFPDEDALYDGYIVTREFMIGSSLVIAPVLEQSLSSLTLVLPQARRWYDMRFLTEIPKQVMSEVSATQFDEAPYFLAGGSMILREFAFEVSRVAHLKNDFEIVVGIGDFIQINETTQKATFSSKIFVDNSDDGQPPCIDKKCLFQVDIGIIRQSKTSELTVEINVSGGNGGIFYIRGLLVLGNNEGFEHFDRIYRFSEGVKLTNFEATFSWFKIGTKNYAVGDGSSLFFTLE